jgi:hypothetical protein
VKPRFLLDEHIDQSIQRQLRRSDPHVAVIAIEDSTSPPVARSDSNILLWMEANDYILITENRSTIPGHLNDHYADGHDMPSLFWIRPQTPLGRVVEELYLIWYSSLADEYIDHAIFIPPCTCRYREHGTSIKLAS